MREMKDDSEVVGERAFGRKRWKRMKRKRECRSEGSPACGFAVVSNEAMAGRRKRRSKTKRRRRRRIRQ